MSFVIFRGVGTEGSLATVGSGNVLTNVYVSRMPSHRKAAMRFTEYYVKGRDGALHVDEGLSNFDLSITLVLIKATSATRRLVNAWADGTGKLITSDDLTKCYHASVKEEVEWTRVSANGGFYDSAVVTFNCEPCMYESSETTQVFTQSGNIVNAGSADSYPLLKIEGSGDTTVTIAGEQITIDDMTANVPVFIDCETGYVYTASGATSMHGNIPYFPVGTNAIAITLGTNASKVTVTPRWRWV